MKAFASCALLVVCVLALARSRLAAISATSEAAPNSTPEQRDWPVYGGDPGNQHYSPLTQINRANVKHLEVAWTFDTGESGGFQTSPIIVEGVLYGLTPSQKVIALDAATGKLRWKFDSGIRGTQPDRGVAYWAGGKDKRVLAGVMNFVYALDASTGTPIASFGKNGRIDLREDLGRKPEAQSIALTSPGVIYKDLLIVGGREPETLPGPPGDIRAYDVRTGKLRWSFHTIPHPGEFGHGTWPKDAWKTSGAANNWAGMTLDPQRGILYAPTGSAAFDFYGGDRIGDDLFANCLIALNAQTGKRIWHFQGVRHDLWDRDFPSPPALLTEDLLTTRTPEAHQWAAEKFKLFRSEGQFVPFSIRKDTVVFPGFDGGAEWGGPAVDVETGIIYINSNDVAWTGALAPNTGENSPRAIYMSQCSVCHGEKMTGSPPAMPSLIGVGERLTPAQIAITVKNGKGRMPGFPNLTEDQLFALINFLTSGKSKELSSSAPAPAAMKYRFTGYHKFLDTEGYPAVAPPWGTLNAINLNTGEYVWKIPLGEYPELAAKGQKNTGTENYGGPIVTAGGLLLIGATNFDKKFRAFDKSTSELLWEAALPFSGNATPATYEVNGRQFVVIAAGGGKDLKSRSGGVYIAFALPQEPPNTTSGPELKH